VRDAAYAKRAKVIVQNNVIGAGITLQAQVMSTRNALREEVNDAIEDAWREWSYAGYCHTGGTLCFADLERAIMAQIFETGEAFIRKHFRSFGGSSIPFALELIEPERLADEFQTPLLQSAPSGDAVVKMGIEVDRFHRPLAYYIRERHPGEVRTIQGETDRYVRVPADQIIHVRIPVDRWPQTRGEPWLHAVARKLNDMDGYSEAEIVAAQSAERRRDLELMRNLVHSHTRRLARYRCGRCGFKMRQFHWQCPACGDWESFPPVRSEDFELAQ